MEQTEGNRHDHTLGPVLQQELLTRLRRIEGQVRGVHRMVEEDRSCREILTQIASVHEAMRGVGRVLVRKHMAERIGDAQRTGDPAELDRAYQEMLDLMYKHVR